MPNTTHNIPVLPRLLILLASAVALLGSAGGTGVALFGTSNLLWATLGFTLIALISAVLGIFAGLGRFADGFGMATLCVGGAIALSAGFAMLDLRSNLKSHADLARLVMPWVGVQTLSAAVIVAMGAISVLARRPASWKFITTGLASLVPAVVLLATAYLGWGMIPEGKNGRVLSLGLMLAGGLVIGTLVSIGFHNLIRAFEFTAEKSDSPK